MSLVVEMGDFLPIYLDNHSTTPTDPRVAQVVLRWMQEKYGNANSADHIFGDRAREAVARAREQVRSLVGADDSDQIIFTSGATESINLALKGLSSQFQESGAERRLRVGLLPIEHPAVLDTVKYLEHRGIARTVYFKVDQKGRIDFDSLRDECSKGLDLVCVMAAQNEIGNLYPVLEIARIVKEAGAIFFTDATQAVGKTELNFYDMGIDFLAYSSHKIYGPQGVGALIIRNSLRLEPIIHGGGHQAGLRSGTLNVPGIVGLGKASQLRREEWREDEARISVLRDQLESHLIRNTHNVHVNGDLDNRLAGNLNIAFPGIPSHALVGRLRKKLAFSTGAACSSGIEQPSYVLRALKLSPDIMNSSLRFGVGKFNTLKEIEHATNLILEALHDIWEVLDEPPTLQPIT